MLAAGLTKDWQLWHARWGHPGNKPLVWLGQKMRGMPHLRMPNELKQAKCKICYEAKGHVQAVRTGSLPNAQVFGELIFSDVIGQSHRNRYKDTGT